MTYFGLADLRTAARSLARTPAVTISAVLCLTLGIGATTAISSAIHRALLEPLPFRQPERLVAVLRQPPQAPPQGTTWPESAPNYVDLARQTRALSALAALDERTTLIDLGTQALQASEIAVTGNLFPMLGVRAERGRLILPSDDQPDQPAVAVLSDELWRTTLGADPAIVGKSISISGSPTTIIGIAPPDFRVPVGPQVFRADVWMPIRFNAMMLSRRRSNFLRLIGRLADNATLASAQAEIRALFATITATYPELRGDDMRVAPLHSDSVQSIRLPLLLLFGAAVMVLSIAVTNVAALLLARGVHRRREMAVRTALGATRWDSMRPALAESALIALAGATLGIGVALIGVRTIGSLAAAQLPQLDGVRLDTPVVSFALLLAVVVSVLCGAVPAWRNSSVDPQDALRAARAAGKEQHRVLRSLATFQVGLSVVLLIGAGLVLKGFAHLLGSDPGFETAHVLSLQVAVPSNRYSNGSSAERFLHPVLDAIRGVPGVQSAAAINSPPYVSWGNNDNVRYDGTSPTDQTELPLAEYGKVTPSFFEVTRQRLIAGRLLGPSDDGRPDAPRVVVVNKALADRDFRGQTAVGKRFSRPPDTTMATIVGVVSDVRNAGAIMPTVPEMYWSYDQVFAGFQFPLLIRVSRGDPAAVVAGVRAAVRRVDPTAAVSHVLPMRDAIALSLGQPRFYFSLLGAFAGVALVLAIAGLYGVLGYVVAQRTREMGIRAALGCSPATLIALVMHDGARMVVGGLVLGLAGGYAATRLMTFMLYGVSPLDGLTWAVALLLMTAAGLLAALVPALRTARVDPLLAMRSD